MSTWIKAIPPKVNKDTSDFIREKWQPNMDRCWFRKEDGVRVFSRCIDSPIGLVELVTVSRAEDDLKRGFSWTEKLQIKEELFGRRRCAIEVYPTEARLDGVAETYQLYVLESGYTLPFGPHPQEYQKAIKGTV